ncbi:hypothetical protein J7T55_002938 [Diaporthe amygdali]|uniref:uncharacterized protein n=1 Tax=Phomopsis amygdali TaxID=1214568 RepID=UPI0022FE5148|nr:uncharacterized protein J7T55_002938 [Diaporthe amygdali]KAJ0122425.1 hypothetical protein J7T55_002938 [Diaporthe amygdali]
MSASMAITTQATPSPIPSKGGSPDNTRSQAEKTAAYVLSACALTLFLFIASQWFPVCWAKLKRPRSAPDDIGLELGTLDPLQSQAQPGGPVSPKKPPPAHVARGHTARPPTPEPRPRPHLQQPSQATPGHSSGPTGGYMGDPCFCCAF